MRDTLWGVVIGTSVCAFGFVLAHLLPWRP